VAELPLIPASSPSPDFLLTYPMTDEIRIVMDLWPGERKRINGKQRQTLDQNLQPGKTNIISLFSNTLTLSFTIVSVIALLRHSSSDDVSQRKHE
jgi:hypothetical protein